MEVLGPRRTILWLIVALIATMGLSARGHGQTSNPTGRIVSRDSVYAAFLLNLTRFIRWPDTAFSAPDAPLVIGTFANESITPILKEVLADERINQRPLVAKEITSLEDVKSCHLIYVSGAEAKRLSAVFAHCNDLPILTVTDVPAFAELGGHVMLDSTSPRIRLRISPENLKRSNLFASSQLLRLAEIVNR